MKLWDPFITEKIPFRISDQEYLLTAIMLELSSIVNKIVASYIQHQEKRMDTHLDHCFNLQTSWSLILCPCTISSQAKLQREKASIDFDRKFKEVELTTNISEADCKIAD